jgi:hypothetical protein
MRVIAEQERGGTTRDDRSRNGGQIAVLLRRESGRERVDGTLAEDALEAVAPASVPLFRRSAPARLLERAATIGRGSITARARRRWAAPLGRLPLIAPSFGTPA